MSAAEVSGVNGDTSNIATVSAHLASDSVGILAPATGKARLGVRGVDGPNVGAGMVTRPMPLANMFLGTSSCTIREWTLLEHMLETMASYLQQLPVQRINYMLHKAPLFHSPSALWNQYDHARRMNCRI